MDKNLTKYKRTIFLWIGHSRVFSSCTTICNKEKRATAPYHTMFKSFVSHMRQRGAACQGYATKLSCFVWYIQQIFIHKFKRVQRIYDTMFNLCIIFLVLCSRLFIPFVCYITQFCMINAANPIEKQRLCRTPVITPSIQPRFPKGYVLHYYYKNYSASFSKRLCITLLL